MTKNFELSWSLLKRFEHSRLPRHTSYPPANRWTSPPSSTMLARALDDLMGMGESICLYLHVPFCARLCHYCGCSRVVASPKSARARNLTTKYVQALIFDLESLRRQWPELRFKRIHLGGGTPNYLSSDEFNAIMTVASPLLTPARENKSTPSGEPKDTVAERSIELDPRTLDEQFLDELGRWGFTHASLGIQDFDPEVQAAIGRVQPLACVERAVKGLRAQGIRSLNFDLIYGLPEQKLVKTHIPSGGFLKTIEQTIALKPDRISLFRLALMVDHMPWQKPMLQYEMPSGRDAVTIFLNARHALMDQGYTPIGLDHFALPSDPLALAQRNGTLVRTFQGMSTENERHVLGLGPTAISCLAPGSGTVYAQQQKDTRSWIEFPRDPMQTPTGWLEQVEAGHALSPAEDILRTTISSAYAQEQIDTGPLFAFWNASGNATAAQTVSDRLNKLQEAGIIRRHDSYCTYTQESALLLRRVLASALDPAVRDADIFPTGADLNDRSDASLVL
jgi:oxygen-independent coproporphyrinogen-3 oxidase